MIVCETILRCRHFPYSECVPCYATCYATCHGLFPMLIAARRALPMIARLLLTLSLAQAATFADAEETLAEAMAKAIVRMMETMGFADSNANRVPGSGLPGASYPMGMAGGMAGWPSAFGSMPGFGVQGMPFPDSAQSKRMAEQVFRQASPDGEGRAEAGSALEGIWEDNQDGLLIVQGGDYRIYASCKGFIEGTIQVGAERVELTNRQENFVQTFEFALDQGRLVLRDRHGQVFLYRRLALGRQQSSTVNR